ncbi:CLAVATA3/ESR (CLE)-related protein 16 [Raphanus sativus]|uniref:CLAVATA3/ESR (CLE)-related protein 16 n=1 Tax=Raphanus sativus TaxID=3726 RepID=A0A9W3CDF3_RAPSA|nr:CLAVATA3/ESR (CLE)-related protein 16 [Raphanus sativus]KAJ4878025.1 CLAVATA3/ESR (CLE)-related protein 16 [Raphanus sativus]
MEDCVRKEHGRRGRRRAAASTMFLCGILIFAQFSLSSSALSPDQYYHQPYPSPRKVGPFHKTASFQSPRASVSFTGPRPEEENRDDVYKDDKRFVHTGPNPLHN